MNRRTRRTLLVVAGVVLLLAVAVFLRSKAPPEAARLLPESDGILYVNLKPDPHLLSKDLKPPERVPEYQQFVDATGVDWERDLDEVAIALHRMPDPNGPNGPVAYSMVLVGKLTGKKLNDWLDAHATSRETYAGHTIYNIHVAGPHGPRDADRLRHDRRLEHAHAGADSLDHRPASHGGAAVCRLVAAGAALPRRAAALAGLGHGPDRPSVLREWRHQHLRPCACRSRPTRPSLPACVDRARCTCASKRLRPARKRQPARRRPSQRW